MGKTARELVIDAIESAHFLATDAVSTLAIIRDALPRDGKSLLWELLNPGEPVDYQWLASDILQRCGGIAKQLGDDSHMMPAVEDRFTLAAGHPVSFGKFQGESSAHDVGCRIARGLRDVARCSAEEIGRWLEVYAKGNDALDQTYFPNIDTNKLDTQLKIEIASVRRELNYEMVPQYIAATNGSHKSKKPSVRKVERLIEQGLDNDTIVERTKESVVNVRQIRSRIGRKT